MIFICGGLNNSEQSCGEVDQEIGCKKEIIFCTRTYLVCSESVACVS